MEWSRKPVKRPNPILSDIRDHGSRSEKRIAGELGGRSVAGSGSQPGYKGDIDLDHGGIQFKVECKATVNNSISLKLGWLQKIRAEALEVGRSPLLTVSFVTPDGRAKPNGEFVVVPRYLFDEMFGEINGKDD